VCLGAQLLARAAGAVVYPNTEPEIGWFPIEPVEPAGGDVFRFASSADVFHWHGETFDLPVGAVHLARSQACEHQAFQLGRSALGLQFHLETTAAVAHGMVENCGDELVPASYVQSAGEILDVPAASYQAINGLMSDVLTYLVDRRAAPQAQPSAAELPVGGR
jgi:hypothetical protein